jgi:hypothetical protein
MLARQQRAAPRAQSSTARRVACRSFQSQRLQLQEQLLDALGAADGEAVRELVLQAKASIQGDFRQFQRCWATAEQQHNSPPRRLRGRPAAAADSRQQAAPAPGPSSAAGARPWAWSEVSSLVVYGLGSLGAYIPQLASGAKERRWAAGPRRPPRGAGCGPAADPPAPPRPAPRRQCTRANSMLHQAALALALQEQLPGLEGRPQVFDPAFTPFDVQLLQGLGFEVLQRDERCARRVARPALFYMPCCTRAMYDGLLGANWAPEQLARLAILGNSFSSLAGSSLLLAALAGGGPGDAAAGGGEGACDGSGYDAASDRAALLAGAGAVSEVFCPDMNVHGVAVSLHTFPQALVQARAGHLFAAAAAAAAAAAE